MLSLSNLYIRGVVETPKIMAKLSYLSRKIPIYRKYSTETSKLFVAISDLTEKYNIKIPSFPTVTVIGPQSSGKSSVIEALCGKAILPKGMRMATMKPVNLTLIRSKILKFKIGDKEYNTEKEAENEIDRANNNTGINKINVTIWSPEVYNSNLMDLPGLFVVAKDDAELPKKIKEMCSTHLKNENNIPLIIHSGPSDPATNQAIKMVYKYKREKDALGIITKVDMLEKQKTNYIKELLTGQNYELGHGYCAVVLRNDKEADKTINDKIKEEGQFFTKMNLHPSGVIQMRKMISEIQYNKIKEHIPKLLIEIENEINNLKTSQNFLTNLLNNDQKRLVSKLRMMIEKLVGSSIDRADFEDKLRSDFKKSLKEYMNEFLKSKNYNPTYGERVDHNILMYNSINRNDPTKFITDGFKYLFSYGLVSPIPIDNQTIKNAARIEISLATSLPLIEYIINDPLGKKRVQWNRQLNTYFSKLLTDDNIHTLIHNITETRLLEYIYNDPEGFDDLTKKFAEYMIKEISDEAYESKIKYSITAMLNLEKRPQVSIYEISRYIAQMYPAYFTFTGKFFEFYSRESKKLNVEVYGDEWNEAYLKVVTDNLTENCYRNVAVNLLDRMVEKLLEMTMDLFNRENALKEQNKVTDKINKLNEIKEIISSYATSNKEFVLVDQ